MFLSRELALVAKGPPWKHTVRHQSVTMKGWLVHDFGEPVSLGELKIPDLTLPNHVLVKVKAAGVNPIDTMMSKGYGNAILSWLKKFEDGSFRNSSRLPFVGGREFSGIITRCGCNVKRFSEGDQVMGVVGPTYTGSHAEYVLVKESWCCPKPSGTSFVEAASVLYSGCTAWTALVSVARLNPKKCNNVRVLINGGSGSVGTVAIQMLKAWNVPVVAATCSSRKIRLEVRNPSSRSLVESLGAIAVDYKNETAAKKQLIALGPFDVILDCVESNLTEWTDNVLGIWRNSFHVSLISPVLRDTDRFGIVPGALSVAAKYFQRSVLPAMRGRWFSYAYFTPSLECIEQIKRYIDDKKLRPIVEKACSFSSLPDAYEKVSQRHGSGKTVLDFDHDHSHSPDSNPTGSIDKERRHAEIDIKQLGNEDVPPPVKFESSTSDTERPKSSVRDKLGESSAGPATQKLKGVMKIESVAGAIRESPVKSSKYAAPV